MSQVFESLSSRKMAAIIRSASTRVVIAAPAIHEVVAEALLDFQQRVSEAIIEVVLDCDPDIMRLGYGAISAVSTLRKHGIHLRQSTGLRIGVLIVDDSGWVFAPAALCVQEEVHSDETPNAVRLSREEAERVVERISFHANEEARRRIQSEMPLASANPSRPELELGLTEVSARRLSSVSEELETVPPIPYELSRQVRVFQPYIQYVDISLRGCAIERKRVAVPQSVIDIGVESQVQDRLKTTFDLIERRTSISSKALEDELRAIRDAYTRALGKPWGRVLLRSKRAEFDEVITKLRRRVAEHEKKVREELADRLEESLKQIIEYYKQIAIDKPPVMLLAQITGTKPTERQVEEWLKSEISRAFPDPASLVCAMHLEVHFRDVTYETLNEPKFEAALREAFSLIDWDKPFNEFNAAREKQDAQREQVP